MQSHKIENNPIFRIGTDVLADRISLDEASNKVISTAFRHEVKTEHIIEMLDLVDDLHSQKPLEVFVYSHLNLLCAERNQVEPRLLGNCNQFHGAISIEIGYLDQAFVHLNVARNIFHKEKFPLDGASCDMNLAVAYRNSHDYDKSVKLFQSAREVFDKNDMQIQKAECDRCMISVFGKLGKYDKCLEHYRSATRLFSKKVGMKVSVASALCDMDMGNIYNKLGEHEKAIELSLSARIVLEERGFDFYVPRCNLNIAGPYRELGLYDKSLDASSLAKKFYQEKHMEIDVATCDMNMANVHKDLDQHDKALKLYNSAVSVFKEKALKVDAARCNMNMATVCYEIAQYDKSIELSQLAREIFVEKGMEVDAATCDMNVANAYHSVGQYNKAITLLLSARKVFVDKIDVATCDMNMASTYYSVGQYDKSIALYMSAIEVFKERTKEVDVAKCNSSMAVVHEELGEYDIALELFQSAKKIFMEKGTDVDVAISDLNVAGLYRKRGQYDKSFELYQAAREVFISKRGMGDKLAICDMNTAHLYLSIGQHEKAFVLFEKIGESYGHFISVRHGCLCGKGNIFEAQKDFEKARKCYELAIGAVETMLLPLSQNFQSSFFDTMWRSYYQMVALCLKQKDFKSAIEYIERLKSRYLAELLKERDTTPQNATDQQKNNLKRLRSQIKSLTFQLNNDHNMSKVAELIEKLSLKEEEYSQLVAELRKSDSSFNPEQVIRISYSEIAGLAEDEDTTIAELFPMSDKTVVFLIQHNTKIEERIVYIPDYTEYNLMDDVSGLIHLYEAYLLKTNQQNRANARKAWENCLDNILMDLYNKLFKRIEKYLKVGSKIVFVPYSVFHLLPLHAMYTTFDGSRRYLLDDYIVSYAPSAKMLKNVVMRERPHKENVVIAFSNPADTDSLPYGRNQVNALTELFGGPQILYGATKKDILEYATKAHIFHYVGHANSNELILHDDTLPLQKNVFSLDQIFSELDLPNAYLATLSGCETGITRLANADEYIGLPSAFLYAGAPTVISSLWSVSDRSTSLLMRKMYESIKEGKGKAEALRNAQLWIKDPAKKDEHLEMLVDVESDVHWVGTEPPERSLPDFSSPYHWAGFICSGVD